MCGSPAVEPRQSARLGIKDKGCTGVNWKSMQEERRREKALCYMFFFCYLWCIVGERDESYPTMRLMSSLGVYPN